MKQRARENLENGLAKLRRWWADKYNLPPNHDLLENQCLSDLLQEMHEDLLLRREELENELEIDGADRASLVAQIDSLSEGIGDGKKYGQDDLIDKWESELAEGKVPDLNEV
jgi:Lon protease-like protein